jgi:hypothetical protein
VVKRIIFILRTKYKNIHFNTSLIQIFITIYDIIFKNNKILQKYSNLVKKIKFDDSDLFFKKKIV